MRLTEAAGVDHTAVDEAERLIRERADCSGLTDEQVRGLAEQAVAGAALLDDIRHFVGRFVRFPSDVHLDAVTLWIAHTHAVDAFDTSPRLALTSAEKRSGKTRALEVIALLAARAYHAVNITAAAMFRLVEAEKPTLLFDEVDAIFGPRAKEHEDVRSLINAGHRRGATVPRCVGKDGMQLRVKRFPVYAAVALAGIGKLPDTIEDRSIPMPMRRRTSAEHVEPFRIRTAEAQGSELRGRLAAWVAEHIDTLRDTVPPVPEGLTDRAADTWEPLLALADLACGQWPARARVAATALTRAAADDDESLGVLLLRHIREVFPAPDSNRRSSAVSVGQLVEMEDAPWGDLRGRPLTTQGLAQRLRPFGIRPGNIRVGPAVLKGYERADFLDAWHRYLPEPESPE